MSFFVNSDTQNYPIEFDENWIYELCSTNAMI